MKQIIPTDGTDPSQGLDREWLLTNERGDYASGTVQGSGTRRYHGLLAVQTPEGRRMLLSTVEDSVLVGRTQVPLSSRIHPGAIWPEGWRHLAEFSCSEDQVTATFRICGTKGSRDEVLLRRTTILLRGSSRILLRYALDDSLAARALGALRLSIRPLASGRDINHLHAADPAREVFLHAGSDGASCSFEPDGIPPLHMRIGGRSAAFAPGADWYYRIEYPVEKERGYDWRGDLLMPGTFTADVDADTPAWFCAGTAESGEDPETEWNEHFASVPAPVFDEPLLEHLRRECGRFLATMSGEPVVPAGYHWFGPWGRDTLIALPGLAFSFGGPERGEAVLAQVRGTLKNGLVPNLFSAGNGSAAWNSADASLWYMLAVHRFALAFPEEKSFLRRECWPVMKEIISWYAKGTMPGPDGAMLIFADERGILHAGTDETQLTWMDASINGVPVTPRGGCPVELNALWYDALCFTRELAAKLRLKEPAECAIIPKLKNAFRSLFVPPDGETAADGGLYDRIRPDGTPDPSIRPNQILAAAVPFSPLTAAQQASVTDCVRRNLLTPYGLRTLAPSDPAYRPVCRGSQAERDAAYHQGTAWPWLLGAYADAVARTPHAGARTTEMLETLAPLFTKHLQEAGLGCISEIFDGDAPHLPGGCIAQAWSTAEVLRLLLLARSTRPREWARCSAAAGGATPTPAQKLQEGGL